MARMLRGARKRPRDVRDDGLLNDPARARRLQRRREKHREVMIPALRHFQRVLDRLEPQSDEGDLDGLSEEVADWGPARARATRLLMEGGK